MAEIIRAKDVYVAWILADGESGGWLVSPSQTAKDVNMRYISNFTFTPPGFATTQLMSMGRKDSIIPTSEVFGSLSLTYNTNSENIIPVGVHVHFEVKKSIGASFVYDQLTHCIATTAPETLPSTGVASITQTFEVTDVLRNQTTARLF